MLNPSTADAEKDDATTRWLVGWAGKNGYDAIRVVNLAAYRATDPAAMIKAPDPHGPENAAYLTRYTAGKVVLCGWGNRGDALPRYRKMLEAMVMADLHCITHTKSGAPAHPSRKSHKLQLIKWAK
jgi:hypothetical protein